VDSEPRVFEEDIQDAIDAAAAPPTVPPAEATSNGIHVDLYFVSDDGLTAVRRSVSSTEPRRIVQTLIGGPTEAEMRLDLRSAIPPATLVRSVDIAEGIAKVDMSHDFASVGGQEAILAVAQMVMTLVATPKSMVCCSHWTASILPRSEPTDH
jgi:spore germination protein GerM